MGWGRNIEQSVCHMDEERHERERRRGSGRSIPREEEARVGIGRVIAVVRQSPPPRVAAAATGGTNAPLPLHLL